MRTVWLLVLAILIAGLVPICAAEEAKKDIPLYDGKPGTKIGDVCVNPKDGAEMVWVPEGEFLMGSTDEHIAALLKECLEEGMVCAKFYLDAEKPQRKVHLDGYWMYKYEVTVVQYRKFCKATSRKMPEAPSGGWKEDHPMEKVTWQDAVDYAKWAGVSLPTEAQWEKAARGTDGRIYPWGNKWAASKCANGLKGTEPVGSYPAGVSPYGAMDMAGNVGEWCADWYDPNYYKNAPTRNPKGPSEAVELTTPEYGKLEGARVSRGTAGIALFSQCAGRYYMPSDDSCPGLGFRCAVLAEKAGGVSADNSVAEAKKDIPLYDGKPGTKIGDVCVNPKDSAKMVWVPAGEFTMGGMDEETAAALKEFPEDSQDFGEFFLNAEKPERKVHLDGYWMYKYEVTVAQYRKFCEATKTEMPKAPEWGWKEDHPMVMVTWQDAADYGKWAGASLPTEAQWEKAARGTDKRIYPWGNKWDASKCANSVETKLKSTQPVGGYASGASPYGCMDMAGNVREWCADLYDPHYYENAPAKNPKGPSEVGGVIMPVSGKDKRPRVLRGGSWQFDSNYAFECIDRGNDDPTIRYNTGGFRCARTP